MFNDHAGKQKQAMELGAVDRAQPCVQGPREMLLEKAEALRREAHNLEHLARSLPPQGLMSVEAERTLTDCIAARIYR